MLAQKTDRNSDLTPAIAGVLLSYSQANSCGILYQAN